MSTIYPTHACFDDALDFLEMRLKSGMPPHLLGRLYTVVHGICLSDQGEPYAHGWVEETDARAADKVWFAGLVDIEGSRERVFFQGYKHEFYDEYRVQKTTRYTVREALAENVRTGHYGPWVEEYQALLANGDHRIVGKIEHVNVAWGTKIG